MSAADICRLFETETVRTNSLPLLVVFSRQQSIVEGAPKPSVPYTYSENSFSCINHRMRFRERSIVWVTPVQVTATIYEHSRVSPDHLDSVPFSACLPGLRGGADFPLHVPGNNRRSGCWLEQHAVEIQHASIRPERVPPVHV